MASGFGTQTKFGRCYNFWQTFYSCSISSPYVDECKAPFEDYFECLHSVKEKKWVRQVEQKINDKKREYKKSKSGAVTPTTIEAKETSHH